MTKDLLAPSSFWCRQPADRSYRKLTAKYRWLAHREGVSQGVSRLQQAQHLLQAVQVAAEC